MDAWTRILALLALSIICFITAGAIISLSLKQMMNSFINQLSISEACAKKGLVYHNRKCRSADEILGDHL